MSSTSLLGPAIAVEGTLIQVGNGASPETFSTIANCEEINLPVICKTVEVTNVGDAWVRRITTLHDMGKITTKVFWVMEEVTHRNNVNTLPQAAGLRYLLIQSLLRDYQIIYPDGDNSTDYFPAYVTGFAISGKVGGVFEAMTEFSNSGAPSLV